jgi:hypothetical protein
MGVLFFTGCSLDDVQLTPLVRVHCLAADRTYLRSGHRERPIRILRASDET